MSQSVMMDLLAVARDAELLGCSADAETLRAEVEPDFFVPHPLKACRARVRAVDRKLRRLAIKAARFGGRGIPRELQIIADPNCPPGKAYLVNATPQQPGVEFALMHPKTLREHERKGGRVVQVVFAS
jgi:hypothetical protein